MRIIRIFVFILICFVVPKTLWSQQNISTLLGYKGYDFSVVFEPEFSSMSKLSYYADFDVTAMYDDIGEVDFDFFHTLSYELINNAGITIGNSFSTDDFMPHLGLYWEYENKSTDITVFPVFVYCVKDEIFGMDTELYFEKFWSKGKLWYPYTLAIINGGFYNDGSWETSILGNLGVSYLKKFQFGFGSSLMYTSIDGKPYVNMGLFLSYRFD